jgi:hypothetical protein
LALELEKHGYDWLTHPGSAKAANA